MKDTFREMQAATLRQPNISTVVKSGRERLDNSLDVFPLMRCLLWMSIALIQHSLEAKAINSPSAHVSCQLYLFIRSPGLGSSPDQGVRHYCSYKLLVETMLHGVNT